MNVYQIEKDYYQISFHNLGFFGSWRCDGSNISGHYTVILRYSDETQSGSFIAWKHGDYAGLTSINELPEIVLELNDMEVKHLNDTIREEFKPNNFYVGGKPMSGNTIFVEDNPDLFTLELVKLLKEGKGYSYEHKYLSPNIQIGDMVTDTKNNETFKVEYFHDLRTLNMHHYYHLTDRDNVLSGCIENMPKFLIKKQIGYLRTAITNGGYVKRDNHFNVNPVGLQYVDAMKECNFKPSIKKSLPSNEVNTKGSIFKLYWLHPNNNSFFIITKDEKIIWVESSSISSKSLNAFVGFTEMFCDGSNGEKLTMHGGTYVSYASYWDNGKREHQVSKVKSILVREKYNQLL